MCNMSGQCAWPGLQLKFTELLYTLFTVVRVEPIYSVMAPCFDQIWLWMLPPHQIMPDELRCLIWSVCLSLMSASATRTSLTKWRQISWKWFLHVQNPRITFIFCRGIKMLLTYHVNSVWYVTTIVYLNENFKRLNDQVIAFCSP